MMMLLRSADAQISASSSPNINTSITWVNYQADCQGGDLANSMGWPTAEQCQQQAVTYGPSCGGALWVRQTLARVVL